ncbi:MAG: hypothetical protein HGB11_08135, partial [Chlorobiales bacterium]|nr:hypothetical protein [Chlorobiales bacterium]
FFTDINTGYAAGYYGGLIKTYDGGNSWVNLFSDSTYWYEDIFFCDDKTGFIGAIADDKTVIDAGEWKDDEFVRDEVKSIALREQMIRQGLKSVDS